MSNPLGRKIEPPVAAPPAPGLTHVRGYIYKDEKGRMHNMQPTPCYSCGSIGRANPHCLLCRSVT